VTKVTKSQHEFLGRLEFALANMVFDGMIDREKMKWAEALGPVVELLQENEPILAVFEGEARGISEGVLDTIRKEFKVCKW
jgi:hypothetical protein